MFGRLPFAGLGFDLGPIVAGAALMRWKEERIVETPAPQWHWQPQASGYELLVLLGREIRAG